MSQSCLLMSDSLCHSGRHIGCVKSDDDSRYMYLLQNQTFVSSEFRKFVYVYVCVCMYLCASERVNARLKGVIYSYGCVTEPHCR